MVDEHRILFESLLSAGTIILSRHGKAICFTKNESGPYIFIVSELLGKIYHEVEQILCQKFGQVDILHSLREWKQTVLSRSEPASCKYCREQHRARAKQATCATHIRGV